MSMRLNPEICDGFYSTDSWAPPTNEAAQWNGDAAESTDEVLMVRVRDGDRDAFRAIVTRHIDRIVALSRRIVGDAEAEEIAQDVFLKLWARKDQWTPGNASFRTWLFRVALNRCIDSTRRRRPLPLDDTIDPVDDAKGPMELYEDGETVQRLRAALRQIPMRQRIAITLYYNNDLTAPEVADIMKLRVNAVESLLKRGRQKLRDLLTEA